MEITMTNELKFPKSWSTASFGGSVETSPQEMLALGDHLGLCKSPNRHVFALHCVAQSMHGFIASRFVTSLLVLALLVGIARLVL